MVPGERLRFGNEDFAVTSKIEQCPPQMMLRELAMNAIEAAAQDPSGKGRVVFEVANDVENMEGIPKLRIWNNGPGLNKEELHKITDMNSTLRKTQSLLGNFGIGAKAGSLSSNKKGLRYRSCRHGMVSEVILHREGEGEEAYYCRKAEEVDGVYETVFDVTEIVEYEGSRNLQEEWTEVVLCGNEINQNTVENPYNNNPSVSKQWASQQLYYRFFRIPANVEIIFGNGTHHRGSSTARFLPITQRIDKYEAHEVVYTESGIGIHYFYDPIYISPSGSTTSHTKAEVSFITGFNNGVSVCFKGELYDFRQGKKWDVISPFFGVPFSSKFFNIVVELPDDYEVRPEEYRVDLKYTTNGVIGDDVRVEDFSALVRNNRPEWFKDAVAKYDKKQSSDEDIQSQLQEILNNSLLRVKSLREKKAGEVEAEEAGARGSKIGRDVVDNEKDEFGIMRPKNKHQKSSPFQPSDKPSKKASMSVNVERAPTFSICETIEEVEEKQISGKAARYYGGDTNMIFLNPFYPTFDEAKSYLENYYANYEDAETMRRHVSDTVDEIMKLLVGKAVVQAKVKELFRDTWTREDIEKAYSPETLSIVTHNWDDLIANYQRKTLSKFRAKKDAA